MRLEMAEFAVTSIKLGDRFQFASGRLTIDQAAIEQAVLREKSIEAAWLEVVARQANRDTAQAVERACRRIHPSQTPSTAILAGRHARGRAKFHPARSLEDHLFGTHLSH